MNKKYPRHIGIILDGNRRWAKEKNLPTFEGHKRGMDNIVEIVPYIINKGVKILSVYAFSTENFKRNESEVKYLMDIFVTMFTEKLDTLNNENIKVIFSGRKTKLRKDVLESMSSIEEKTKNNTKGIFNICINYGGQQEIVDATKKVVEDVQNKKLDISKLDENKLYEYMYNNLGPMDLMIRTSGEQRISNYMIYELSYAELYFTSTFFPDFNSNEFEKAIDEFNRRNRRFGGN